MLDERIVLAMSEIVVVLNADDLGNASCFLELARRHGADADVSDEALALQLCKHLDLGSDRPFLGPMNSADAHVDHVERLDAEIAQIVMHLPDETACLAIHDPGTVSTAP